jgi:hypothetical protein
MQTKPLLFVGVWADAEKSPGLKLSISSRTPYGFGPDGKVDALVPRAEDLRLYKTGVISLVEFGDRYTKSAETFGLKKLAPGKLVWSPFSFFDQDKVQPVLPGDHIFCACDVTGDKHCGCHRRWAAEILERAGWNVVIG